MYNDAFVDALNADRERRYAQLERERRQREITALRALDAQDGSSVRVRTAGRGRHGATRIAHAAR